MRIWVAVIGAHWSSCAHFSSCESCKLTPELAGKQRVLEAAVWAICVWNGSTRSSGSSAGAVLYSVPQVAKDAIVGLSKVGANQWCCCCCLLSCLTIWFLVAHFQFVSVESQFKAWVRVGWVSDDEPQFQTLAAIKQAIVALVGDLPHCSISRCQFGHIAFPSFKRC